MFRNVNKVIRTMVFVDFFYNSAFGSFAPVFAVFITSQIQGGSVEVVGFSIAVYWVIKSIFQLPIARFLDKTDGERDDFWAMFLGYFLSSFVPIAFIFVKTPTELYLVQGIHGFLMAWAVPSWYGIFTRHVDKWRISLEWSLQSVFSVGLSTALAAALGGLIIERFGFQYVFLAAGVISILCSFLILRLKNEMLPRHREDVILPERHRENSI